MNRIIFWILVLLLGFSFGLGLFESIAMPAENRPPGGT